MKTILLPLSLLLLCAAAIPAPAQELATVAAQPAVLADARTSPDGCAVRLLPDGKRFYRTLAKDGKLDSEIK